MEENLNLSEIPQTGWKEIGVIDVRGDGKSADETNYEPCMMCSNEKIRFVHILIHENIKGTFRVGYNCATKMTGDYTNPENLEKELEKRSILLRSWQNKHWKTLYNGNLLLEIKGHSIFINQVNNSGKFKVRIDETDGNRIYYDIPSAKYGAFVDFEHLIQKERMERNNYKLLECNEEETKIAEGKEENLNLSEIPQEGWKEIAVVDVRAEGKTGDETKYEPCMMCNKEKIRFVHILIHENIKGTFRVGYNCATIMTGGYTNPENLESEFENRHILLRNWQKKHWQTLPNGNLLLKIKDHTIFINQVNNSGRFIVRIDKTNCNRMYNDIPSAKYGAFIDLYNLIQKERMEINNDKLYELTEEEIKIVENSITN